MRGRYGGDVHVFHEFDAALCGITVENAALCLSLVGHPWPSKCQGKVKEFKKFYTHLGKFFFFIF